MAILVLQHSDSSPVGRLGATLRDHGQRLDVRNLHRGDPLPPDLDNIDGIIACGGAHSPVDDEIEWLAPEMNLLADAAGIDLPVIGICFGCQILARALGGSVAPMEDGGEFGWHPVTLNHLGAEDPLHAGVAWTSQQIQHHRYEVTELPSDAKALASSPKCNVQTWHRGLRTYGFQYHPEADAQALIRWAREEPQCLDEAGLSMQDLEEQTKEHYAAFERLTGRLFDSIALLLMPVDRRYHGLVKDLHT